MCEINLKITPTWSKGKTHQYCSRRPSSLTSDMTIERIVELPEPSQVTPSPKKRKEIHARTKQTGKVGGCRICGKSDNICFWIGCGHKNPVTKKLDCKFWVHQWCIGLYYKTEEKLKHVPYFCEEHGRKKQK